MAQMVWALRTLISSNTPSLFRARSETRSCQSEALENSSRHRVCVVSCILGWSRFFCALQGHMRCGHLDKLALYTHCGSIQLVRVVRRARVHLARTTRIHSNYRLNMTKGNLSNHLERDLRRADCMQEDKSVLLRTLWVAAAHKIAILPVLELKSN